MSTPTTRGKYKLLALGEGLNTWGISGLNQGVFERQDEALHGYREITLTGTTYALTATNYVENDIRFRQLKFTGNFAATITIPSTQNWWFIENATGQTLTFSNGTNTATLGNAFYGLLTTNGTTLDMLTLPDGVNVETVATDIANVNTVAGQISPTNNIATLAAINAAISGVSAISTDVTAVNTDPLKTNIGTTAGAVTNINTVAGQISPTNNIATVASADANITTVAGQISPTNNLSTVAGIASDVSTTAGANANITTVAGQISPTNNLGTVAGIASDISTAAGSNTEITSVAGQISPTNNIATVAGSTANIATVAGQISPTNNLSTVAGISSDISGVAAITSDISAVNTNPFKQSIIDVDANSTNINNVGGSITSVNTVANNLTSVNSFGNTYQISTNNPTTDGGGNPLSAGDLSYVTSASKLRVYNGSSWEDAGSATNGTVDRHSYVATANQTTFPATGAISYNPNFVDVYLNGVKLVNGTDVTVSSGSNIVLATGAAVNDTVDVVAYGTFALADMYTKTQSDNRYYQNPAVADLDMGSQSISNGVLRVKNQGSQSQIRLYCEISNAHYTALQASPHSAYNGNIVLTLPSNTGTVGQLLQTDGNGVMTWVNAPAGSSIASTLKFA